jgi:hypothetical protein
MGNFSRMGFGFKDFMSLITAKLLESSLIASSAATSIKSRAEASSEGRRGGRMDYHCQRSLAIAFGVFALSTGVCAQTQTETQVLAKYGLSTKQYQQLQKEITAVRSLGATKAKPPADAAPVPKTTTTQLPTLSATFVQDGCRPASKALFVRGDPLDNFHYLVDPQAPTVADAKGASVSYTDNRVAQTQSATIDGRISYLLFGEQCDGLDPLKPFISGVAIAPFVSSNGTWDEPIKKTSTSALKYGSDFQLSLSTTQFLITDHYFYASPYYQTDYRNLARVTGAIFAYEPVASRFFLDAGPVTPYFSFFWQLRAEADIVDVESPGLTNLKMGSHTWIGATARPNLALFPLNSTIAWPDWLGGRISLIGTFQYYQDTENSVQARYYSAILQYKLGECKRDPKGSTDLPCSIQGSSAISFEYDWGTDIDTLVKANQYLVKFSYAY